MAKILNIGFDQQFFPKSIEVNLEKCPWLIKICLIQQIKAKMIQSNYLKRMNLWNYFENLLKPLPQLDGGI